MELIKQYRRKALMPWLVIGSVCVAGSLIYTLASSSQDKSGMWLVLIIYAICFVIANFRALTGIGSQRYRQYVQRLTQDQVEELARQFETREKLGHAVMTDDCILILSSQTLSAIPYDEIVWVYQAGQTTRFSGKVYTMIVVTRDKKNHLIDLFGAGKAVEPAKQFFLSVSNKVPSVYIGRDKETNQLYRKDFEKMCNTVTTNRQEME